MTPEQFLAKIAKQPPLPAYLFLGQEGYQRKLCREALLARLLPGDARAEGFTQVDLDGLSLSEVLDDARSLSLFASERLIWIAGYRGPFIRARAHKASSISQSTVVPQRGRRVNARVDKR